MEQHKSPEPVHLDPQAHDGLDFEIREDHLLHCPSCDHFVNADDINIQKLMAKCANCGQVFSFEHARSRDLAGYSRPDMLMPEGLEVLKLENELDVVISWFKSVPRALFSFTLIFTLIWNLILLPFILIGIGTGAYEILLFTSAHLAVGVGFLLRTLALFINKTHVNVSRKVLEIRSGPMPAIFRRNRKIPVYQIDQLYVTKYVDSRTNGNPNYAYALYVILKSGQKLKLAKGMNLQTQRYLEYEIESFLGIRDRKVDGAENT
jgi:hypothetical protein